MIKKWIQRHRGILSRGWFASVVVMLLAPTHFAFAWNPLDIVLHPLESLSRLAAVVVGAFVGFYQFVLDWSAGGFNNLIDYTIIHFTTKLGFALTSIDTIWAVFRDFANIALIGVFVYIAFNVMLNVTSFDAPKFAVRVIIIAVLINFSLFFTKVIIDVSNVTAIQFYNKIENIITTNTADSNNKHGIAGVIEQYTGISSVFNTQKIVDEGVKNGETGFGALMLYLVFTTFFYAGISSVLFYGEILLATRALTLIFLMIASPLAFAAYMIPALEGHWKNWWSSLLKNALFAPLFMLLLWASLSIIIKMSTGNGAINLMQLMTSPTGSFDILFQVVIVLGLFYYSLKIASSASLIFTDFANDMAKKSFGGAVTFSGLGLGMYGATSLAEVGSRKLIGGVRNKLQRVPILRGSETGYHLDRFLDKAANKNFGDTALGKGIHKSTGVGFITKPPGYDMKKYKGEIDEKIKQKEIIKEETEKISAAGSVSNFNKQERDEVAKGLAEGLETAKEGSTNKVASLTNDIKTLQSAENKATGGAKKKIQEEIDDKQAELAKESAKIDNIKDAINDLSDVTYQNKIKNAVDSGSNAAADEQKELQKIIGILKSDNQARTAYEKIDLKMKRHQKRVNPTDSQKKERMAHIQKVQEENPVFKTHFWNSETKKEAKEMAAESYSGSNKQSGGKSSSYDMDKLISKLEQAGIDKGTAEKALKNN